MNEKLLTFNFHIGASGHVSGTGGALGWRAMALLGAKVADILHNVKWAGGKIAEVAVKHIVPTCQIIWKQVGDCSSQPVLQLECSKPMRRPLGLLIKAFVKFNFRASSLVEMDVLVWISTKRTGFFLNHNK